MAIHPDEVRNKTFPIVRKGYAQPDVHRYLAAIADEVDKFNRSVVNDEEIVMADIVEVQPDEAVAHAEVASVVDDGDVAISDSNVADVPMSGSSDDFDRVGNEISLMLRQAQESSIKIRNDAEVEARTLVDQVRLDIEADRLAHEQAAGELIARTEERAGEVRVEAEEYATQTRTGADEYATERRAAAEREVADAESAAASDRDLAATALTEANQTAEATVANAEERAQEIIATAEAEAKQRSDALLGEARATLSNLTDAERISRDNLEDARMNIQTALDQLQLTEIDTSSIDSD